MNDWQSFIASVGFPVFVAAFILIRLEPAIKALTATLDRLTAIIQKCEK